MALKSPLRGKYLIRNLWANKTLALLDLLLTPLRQKNTTRPLVPKNLLLCNGAHLGDVVLSTAVLPVLKSALPETKIGFLTGSWSKVIVEKHPLIDWVHCVDHWKHNRSSASMKTKWKHYFQTRKQALREIKEIGYDAAVDLYFHFPNTAALLWQADIPVRVGYISAGFSPLLTHAINWHPSDKSVVDYFLDVLEVVLPIENHRAKAKPNLGFSLQNERFPKNSIVIHMGTGNPIKEWPSEKWKSLSQKLIDLGFILLFTGKGERERKQIEFVTGTDPRMINFCDRLNFEELYSTIEHARLLISLDTGLGHITSSTNTPAVLLYTGITPTSLWRPYSQNIQVLKHPTACSPCYLSKGCEKMSCVRDIEVETVYDAVKKLLEERSKRNENTNCQMTVS